MVAICFFILYALLLTWELGVLLSVFWAWFVVSGFPTLPLLTTVQSIGLFFVLNIFLIKEQYTKESTDIRSNLQIINDKCCTLLIPWILLASGWVFKVLFIM